MQTDYTDIENTGLPAVPDLTRTDRDTREAFAEFVESHRLPEPRRRATDRPTRRPTTQETTTDE